MVTKSAGEIKRLDKDGSGTLVFAQLGKPDKDGDVLMPTAIGEQTVAMVGAHDWEAPPIGKARICEAGNEAVAHFALNLETTLGRNWHAAIKFDFDHPPSRQQYSYGFTPDLFDYGELAGTKVRFLRKVTVHEVSPVLVGAGETRTLSLKGRPPSASSAIPFDPARIQKRLEQSRAFLLEARFSEMAKNIREVKYREIDHDFSMFDLCHLVAREAASELQIKPPANVKFFREARHSEKADFVSSPCLGQCDEIANAIYIRADLGGSNLLQTIGHEVSHLARAKPQDLEGKQRDEAEAREFGERFAARFGKIPAWSKLYALYSPSEQIETVHEKALPGSWLLNFRNGWAYEMRQGAWQRIRRWRD